MKKPTDKQIAAEVAKLKTQRPHLPPSAFGDDNAGACGAQIHVLEQRILEQAIYSIYDEPADPDAGLDQQEQHKLDAALEAGRWLAGESSDVPSVGWEPMYRRATGKA